MKNLKLHSFIFLFILLSSVNATTYSQQPEVDVHSGSVDVLDFANRYILINDLPLFFDADTAVLSKSQKRISRYKLKLGQLVKVEYQYDAKLNKERASKISIIE